FAWTGDYGGTGYPAGKGAVTSLTMAIAAELAEHGVRANVVCPGARTRLSSGDQYEEQIRELGRRGMLDELSVHGALDPGGPEYVAPLYTYLVSELADGITGGVFAGSGGFVGRFPTPESQILAYRDFHDSPPWTPEELEARKSTRLNSSHVSISCAVPYAHLYCLPTRRSSDLALDPGGPEYVAPLYTYLVSELADGITGGVFAGSGGFVGRFPTPESQILAYRDFHDSPPWTPEELDGFIR